MFTCETTIKIIESCNIGNITEIGISPYTNAEREERGGNIGTWMKPKTLENISQNDMGKIVIAIKINNTFKLNYTDISERVVASGLLDQFFFSCFQNNPDKKERYFVKLQKYEGLITMAKIYPITEKYYIGAFDGFNKSLLKEVPEIVELDNKVCYFGSPIIFENPNSN